MGKNFIDYVKIFTKSGAGGSGSIHFRREKFVPKGGPDGGDGGRGGHIILQGDSQLWTLLHLKYRRHVKAKQGANGEGNHKTGANGKDVILKVPLGTIAKDAESGKNLVEVVHHGERKILLQGGRGGLGNSNFKSATNQSPRYAQKGGESIECPVILELKILADVGLVGFPNAGKSTLLSVISAAKPEIADYPFTTLTPNLGVVAYREEKSFVMADIPGLIEGAAGGKGLGIRFLRHIERNSLLLFIIPSDAEDIYKEYKVLVNELRQYNPELLNKTHLIAVSKSDLLDKELHTELEEELKNMECVFISSFTKDGILRLKDKIWGSLNNLS